MRTAFMIAAYCPWSRLALGLLVALTALPARAEIHAFGAMGDSLTDEYAEEGYDYAANWIEQLAQYRNVNVGPTAAQSGQPGGTWGEPRRTGFELNWARSGDDSGDLLAHGQHTGLAALAEVDGITHAVLMIGANDFYPLPLPGYAYFAIYNGYWSQAQIDAYVEGIVANIQQALDAVVPTGVCLAICTAPDYGVSFWPRVLFPDPVKRERVTTVIRQLNLSIDAVARERHLVLVDMFAAAQAIFGTNLDLREVLLLGNVEIYVQTRDTAGNDDPQAGFVDDGTHPHTHLQGILANLILHGLNTACHAETALFTEEEILAHAGLAYGGVDTLESEIGPYGAYVSDYTLADGDLDRDEDVDFDDYGVFVSCMAGPEVRQPPGSCSPAEFNLADVNGDYDVDVDDFRWLQADFGGQ
jgi:lysophospholipase L1-like esterase